MISAAVRSDASSRLAPGHQWHTYPAVSVGWNVHNEPFMAGTRGWLDELKLRVGYGVTSNQAVTPYSTLGSLSTKVYNFNEEKYATGYYVSSLPNTELGWEYSNTWNFGLDYSFFKGRLRGTVEYYRVDTKDILLKLR
ncbi:TonB-dependent receptor, partial [Vibrio sp. FNV 38]|nr:TonB-dependent receptor [Vibrio sp. FNV 38]